MLGALRLSHPWAAPASQVGSFGKQAYVITLLVKLAKLANP
jgi:hypothetical protein